MRRLLTALAFCLFATAAGAQGCGSSNPNCIVPTAPVGTSDNRAASTAFVQHNGPWNLVPSAGFYPPFDQYTANSFPPALWTQVNASQFVATSPIGSQAFNGFSDTSNVGFKLTTTQAASPANTLTFLTTYQLASSCTGTCYVYDLTTPSNIPSSTFTSSVTSTTVVVSKSTTVAQGDVIWIIPTNSIAFGGYFVADNDIVTAWGNVSTFVEATYSECRAAVNNSCYGLEVDAQNTARYKATVTGGPYTSGTTVINFAGGVPASVVGGMTPFDCNPDPTCNLNVGGSQPFQLGTIVVSATGTSVTISPSTTNTINTGDVIYFTAQPSVVNPNSIFGSGAYTFTYWGANAGSRLPSTTGNTSAFMAGTAGSTASANAMGQFVKGIVFSSTMIAPLCNGVPAAVAPGGGACSSALHYEAMNLFSGNISGLGQVAQEIDWYDDAGNETRFAPAQNNIQTTSTDGTVLANWTAAVSAHKQQYSPRIHWYGSGWDFSPAAARTFDFTMESRPNAPTAGTAATAALTISEGENGGTISRIAGFYSTTTGTDGGGLFYSSIVSGGYLNTASLLLTSNNCTGAGNLGSSSTSSFCGSSGGGGGGSSDTIQLATGSGVRMTILSNGNVGLGKETNPQGSFVLSANTNTGLTKATDLADFIAADGATAAVGFLAATNTTGNGTTLNGAFVFRTANGTVASPTALGTGSTIGNLGFGPYNGTNFTQTAKIQSFTGPSFNGTTDKGSYIEIDATANSGTTLAAAARFQAGVIIGVGTVDPGAGNLVMGTASTGPLATVNYANLTLNQTTGGNIAFQAASITQWQVFNTSTQFVIEDVVDTQNMMTFTAGAVGAGFITFPNTLDATNSTTAAHVISGGLAVAKKIITGSSASINTSSTTGTALNTSGTVFMASLTSVAVNEQDYICLTSANQIVADTTTCLASSARFKNILGPMEDGALQKIDRIEVNRWRYKPEGDFTTERWTRERIGPTAENIAAIDPRLVEFDPQGEPLKVSPDQLLALTIKAVQELKAANDNLEAEVQLLRRAR